PRAGRCVNPDRRGPQMITWPFDWTVYAGLALLFFGHAWLARGASDAQPRHTVYLLAGLATLWIALESPIDTMSDRYLDSVHMLQHVLLGFVAPPLLLLSLSREMVSRIVRAPGVRPLTEPAQAQVIAAAVVIDQTIAGAVLMIFGKVTMAVAALAIFFRWFGAEHGSDRGIESRLGVR